MTKEDYVIGDARNVFRVNGRVWLTVGELGGCSTPVVWIQPFGRVQCRELHI